MNNVAFTYEQMKHLESLGLDATDASMCYESEDCVPEVKSIHYVNSTVSYREGITFAYTFADAMKKFPHDVEVDEVDYFLSFDSWTGNDFNLAYVNRERHKILTEFISDDFNQLAFDMLCFCIENNIQLNRLPESEF